MSSKKKTVEKESTKATKSSRLPLIFGLAFLLGLGGYGAWYFLNNNSGKGLVTEKTTEPLNPNGPQTPTEAYKKLFAAVSSKDKPTIKGMMSKDSLGLAQMQSGQSKKGIDEVLANGFFTANKSPSEPAIRDERVKGKFGAIEVFSKERNAWENMPWIVEDGEWKLAVGNMFSGKFVSPGKSRTTREKEQANASGQSDIVPYGNGNVNFNAKPKIIDPMKDGKIPVQKVPKGKIPAPPPPKGK